MRYKPKSIAALHIALGGLPDKMRVEVDRDIGMSARTIGELRKLTLARELGDNNPAGAPSRQRGEDHQGNRKGSRFTQAIGAVQGHLHWAQLRQEIWACLKRERQ